MEEDVEDLREDKRAIHTYFDDLGRDVGSWWDI